MWCFHSAGCSATVGTVNHFKQQHSKTKKMLHHGGLGLPLLFFCQVYAFQKKPSHLSAHCNDCGTSFAFYDITTIAPKYVRVELTAVTVTSSGSFYSAWRWRSPPIKRLVTLIENISFKIRNCFLPFFFSFYKGSSTDLHVVQVQLSHHNL